MTNFLTHNFLLSYSFVVRVSSPRFFHGTSGVYQRPDHPLYAELDWGQVRGGHYAVVDPMDPSNILYLSPRAYIASQKTWISNDVAVVVLATPKDTPSPSSTSSDHLKNSPRKKSRRATINGWGQESYRAFKGRVWGCFSSPMIKFINTYVSSKSVRVSAEASDSIPQPAVEINQGNLMDLTLSWGHNLHFKLFGLASDNGFRNSLNLFALHVTHIFQTQGGLQLTKRLKVYALCVKAYLGKAPYKSTEALGVRISLANGLPKALPPAVRSVLRSRPVRTISLWISILHYYKAMVVKRPKPDLSGVIANPVDLPLGIVKEFTDFQKRFWTLFKDVLSRKSKPDYSDPTFYSSFKSGPNMRPALAGILPDLFAWIRYVCSFTFIPEYKAKNPIGPQYKVRDLVKVSIDMCKHVEGLVAKSLSGDLENDLDLTPLFRFGNVWGIRKWLFKAILLMIPEIIRQIEEQTGYSKASGNYDFMALYLDMEREARGASTPKGVKAQAKKRATENVYNWHAKLFASLDLDASLPEFYHEQGPGLTHHLTGDIFHPEWGFLGSPSDELAAPILTRLSFLNEPAGKVRMIAIVDWWTQQALKPIHDWMFDLLASLPSDATFSQEGSLREFSREVEKEVYSFDLKSATEMIPQQLYTIVFGALWGPEKADSWMALLAKRWFHYNYVDEVTPTNNMSGVTRYRRGQPMGALSSWASMALVHHSVIQFAAFRAHLFPFWNYRVLGDDVVLGDKRVAMAYLEACDLLGIPISLSKSLQSTNGFFDFASQILQYRRNFSPISLREELSAYNPCKRIEAALRSVRRGLADFTKPSWFSDFLKLVVTPTVYQQIVEARKLGKLDAAAKAVLIQTLGHLEIKPGGLGLEGVPRVTVVDAIKAVMPTMAIFRTDFKTALGLGNDRLNESARDIAMEAICYRADRVYKQFLETRPLLQKWRECTSVAQRSTLIWEELKTDLKYLSKLLSVFPTIEDKLAVYTKWEETYRRPLKTIQVCSKLRPMSPDLLEHTCEATLDELWDIVCKAEAELMVKPDMVLGVEPSVKPKNILRPTAAEIHSSERFFARLGVWTHLVETINSDQSLSLSIPGLRRRK